MSSSIITPSGVHGTIPPVPVDRRPTLTGWNPSTSLSGAIARSTVPVSMCAGSGTWHQDAVDLGIGVEPGDQRQQRVLRGLGSGRRCSKLRMPTSSHFLILRRT